jgi:hypothetical protein
VTHYTELVFLHPVGSVGHVVISDVFGARNINAMFSCSVGPGAVSIKKLIKTSYTEHVFLYHVGPVGHVVYFGVFEAQNVNALFSCSVGPGAVSIKSSSGQVTPNMYFCIMWDLRVT